MDGQQGFTFEQQQTLITNLIQNKLGDTVQQPVEHIETHISHVLLGDNVAYKIKKPLDLGFLDFSTLERRKFCCEEELRLNHRLAEDIYESVVTITGSLDHPELSGNGPVLEYAVKMVRFDQADLLSRNPPDDATIMELADKLACFHPSISQAPEDTAYGNPDQVIHPMLQNFDQIRGFGADKIDQDRLAPLEQWTIDQADQLNELLESRKKNGHIRECHGDLHLGNITRYQGPLQVFDGIEFNPNLSWIDTINDLAFLIMDLRHRNLPVLAQKLLNAYLEKTGDYEALPLLRFYQVYRAMVRAKVSIIRLGQPGLTDEDREEMLTEFNGYIELAEQIIRRDQVAMLITHGFSGSGKSFYGSWIADNLQTIHIRSDIERQRLFKSSSQDNSAGINKGIYNPDATQATYDRLLSIALDALNAGYSVLIDATFLRSEQRDQFRHAAASSSHSFILLDFEAPDELLRSRVQSRLDEAKDASEADIKVLEAQQANHQPLSPDELKDRVCISPDTSLNKLLLDEVKNKLRST